MNIQLSIHDWLELPMEVRVRLRQVFSIPRSEGSRVVDNKVESDGTTYKDLGVVTIEAMRKYLGVPDTEATELDFKSLFEASVFKVKEELSPQAQTGPEIDPKQLFVDEWVAILSRIKGQAVEKGMEDYLDTAIKRVFNIKPTVITQTNAEPIQKRRPGRPKKAK